MSLGSAVKVLGVWFGFLALLVFHDGLRGIDFATGTFPPLWATEAKPQFSPL